MTGSNRYVISAPRSGLNWLRYCVEHFYGVRTPGRKVIISEDECPSTAFVRSHRPLGRRKDSVAWTKIDPFETADGCVMLILRHPLETFVRMADRNLKKVSLYTSNIKFYTSATAKRKAVYYYEDLTSSPNIMAEALDFLAIKPSSGYARPPIDKIANQWDTLAAKSRDTYDITQTKSGGARTIDDPYNFAFHQRLLSDWEKRRVWDYLKRRLNPDEYQLLSRYHPNPGRFFGLLPSADTANAICPSAGAHQRDSADLGQDQ